MIPFLVFRYVYISLEEAAEARAGLYSLRGNDDDVDYEIKEMEEEKKAEQELNSSISSFVSNLVTPIIF